MEPRVSPELEEESIIIVYAGLETGLYATDMERGVEFRGVGYLERLLFSVL